MKEFLIFTDGSANSSNSGGSACIIHDTSDLRNYYLLSSFGHSTNNQAELFATFLGYVFIKIFNNGNPALVSIVSDSQYTLGGSTKYIKKWLKDGALDDPYSEIANKPFWKYFLNISSNLSLDPQHVRGHQGHGENEKCDEASGWARKNHSKIETGSFVEIRYPKTRASKEIRFDWWFYLNLEEIFASICNSNYPTVMPLYTEVNRYFSASIAEDSITTEDRVYEEMLRKVKEAITLAKKYTHSDDRILELSDNLRDIVEPRHAAAQEL